MNGRRFGLWTLLVAVSTAPGLARDSRSRPLLAPVALEARCPLADGTWHLDPVERIAARPATAPPKADAAADKAAPAPAEPANEPKVAKEATEPAGGRAEQPSREAFPPASSEDRIDELLGEYLSYDLNPRDRFRLALFPLQLPQFSYLPGVARAVITPDDAVAQPARADAKTRVAHSAQEQEKAVVEEDHVPACFPIETAQPVESDASVAVVELHGPPAPAREIELPASLLARYGGIDCLLDEMCWRAGRLADSLPQQARGWLQRLGREASGPVLALRRGSDQLQQLALAAANELDAKEAEVSVALKAPYVPSAAAKPIVTIQPWATSGRSVCCPVAQNVEYGGLYDKRFEDARSAAPAIAKVEPAPSGATLEATADTLDAVASWLQGLSRSLRHQSQRIAERADGVELR